MSSTFNGFRLVVATSDGNGNPTFIENDAPESRSIPGVADVAYLWRLEGDGTSPTKFGGPGRQGGVAPGGSTLKLIVIPPRSAGTAGTDVASLLHGATGGYENPAMHSTNSVDYQIVLSGRIDFVMPGNQRRTLSRGDILVDAGMPHAWENHYDEPCTYLSAAIGVAPD